MWERILPTCELVADPGLELGLPILRSLGRVFSANPEEVETEDGSFQQRNFIKLYKCLGKSYDRPGRRHGVL